MRPWLALSLLVLTLPSVGAHPICTQVGCATVEDLDDDGVPDHLVLAVAVEALAVNARANNTTALAYAELFTGDHVEDPGALVSAEADLAYELHGEHLDVHGGNVTVLAGTYDHETGAFAPLVVTWLGLHDHDEDGVPESRHLVVLF